MLSSGPHRAVDVEGAALNTGVIELPQPQPGTKSVSTAWHRISHGTLLPQEGEYGALSSGPKTSWGQGGEEWKYTPRGKSSYSEWELSLSILLLTSCSSNSPQVTFWCVGSLTGEYLLPFFFTEPKFLCKSQVTQCGKIFRKRSFKMLIRDYRFQRSLWPWALKNMLGRVFNTSLPGKKGRAKKKWKE